MHGNIMVNDPPTVSAMGRLAFTLLVALVLGTGLFFLRQRRQRA
jgi:hypothetical protein